MNGVVLLIALAAPGVDYGWRSTSGGEVECIVQLETPLASALARGEAPLVRVRDTAPRQQRPSRFVIQIGDQPLPQDPLASRYVESAAFREEAKTSYPYADFAPHAWRRNEAGELQCLIHIDPRLIQAVLDEQVEGPLTGGPLPASDESVQYLVYVTDQALPADAVPLDRVEQQVGAERSRIMQLSHNEPGRFVDGGNRFGDQPRIADARTVFETQLQLRRGEADLRFEADRNSPAPTAPAPGASRWDDRNNAAPVGGSVGDTNASSRFGSGADRNNGNRYGGGANNTAAAPAGDGLQIRFGDPEDRGARLADVSDTNPNRFAAASRFSDTNNGTPPAPPLGGSQFGNPRDTVDSRTSLGGTSTIGNSNTGAANSNATYLDSTRTATTPPPAQPNPAFNNPTLNNPALNNPAGYGGPAVQAPTGGLNPNVAAGYDPRAYPAQPPYQDPRVAARGGYTGPFQGAYGAPGTNGFGAAGEAANATLGEKEKPTTDEEEKPVVKEAEPQWVPLMMAVMALLASLSGNAYLGHMAYGFYRRYREMTDELRSTPEFSGESSEDSESRSSSGGRRRRRGRLAARF